MSRPKKTRVRRTGKNGFSITFSKDAGRSVATKVQGGKDLLDAVLESAIADGAERQLSGATEDTREG